jgi:hypothetical protein
MVLFVFLDFGTVPTVLYYLFFWNLELFQQCGIFCFSRFCHTVGTVPKSAKTNNTTLLEQFQNLEKQIMPLCWNSSKI